jgi:cell division protein FtsB
MLKFRHGRFDLAVSVGCLALLGYFAAYAMVGARGLGFRDKLMAQNASLSIELNKVRTARQALEHRVVELRPESVDPDLADELARGTLSVAKSNELVVLLPK